LEFLGNFAGFTINNHQVKQAVSWLMENQEKDGSWYGRWGVCYIYGTWAAVTGLLAVGVPKEHTAIQRAIHWLSQQQNPDGGWGESCKSDMALSFYREVFIFTSTAIGISGQHLLSLIIKRNMALVYFQF
jgi:sporulenol synthase